MTDLHQQIITILRGDDSIIGALKGDPTELLQLFDHSLSLNFLLSEDRICVDILIRAKRLEALTSPVAWIRERAKELRDE